MECHLLGSFPCILAVAISISIAHVQQFVDCGGKCRMCEFKDKEAELLTSWKCGIFLERLGLLALLFFFGLALQRC